MVTPQELITSLLLKSEEQGRHLLQTQVPLLKDVALDQFVFLLKKETDRRWANDAQSSFLLSGYLLFIGDFTHNAYYHATWRCLAPFRS